MLTKTWILGAACALALTLASCVNPGSGTTDPVIDPEIAAISLVALDMYAVYDDGATEAEVTRLTESVDNYLALSNLDPSIVSSIQAVRDTVISALANGDGFEFEAETLVLALREVLEDQLQASLAEDDKELPPIEEVN